MDTINLRMKRTKDQAKSIIKTYIGSVMVHFSSSDLFIFGNVTISACAALETTHKLCTRTSWCFQKRESAFKTIVKK